jgi:uncharacterized RDD family membrane protein YckC
MATPIDQLQKDRRLQEHWLRRFVAFIIDAIIITVIVYVIVFAATFGAAKFNAWSIFFTWGFAAGVAILLYTGILEGIRGATIGKQILKMRVVSQRGPMDIGKGLIRNISKIWWLLLLIDLLVGFLTGGGGATQRYIDRIAGTYVQDVP